MKSNHPLSAVLITGAGGGLGKALVNMATTLPGVDVVVATDLHEYLIPANAEKERIVSYRMDIRSEASIRYVRQDLDARAIQVKYLINNAGVSRFFPITESTEARLDDLLEVNLRGQILTVRNFLDHLIQKRGRVVQISSDSVRLPTLFHPYPASKIALEAFCVSMRQELKLHDVELVLVRPGAIRTPFIDQLNKIENPTPDSLYQKPFETFAKIAGQNVGKQLKPEKVARLVKKILMTPKPKLVYSINKNRKISLVNLFPGRMRDGFIVRSVARKER
jgi:NAD(P)-dependent dehydrogenase (short-subunit alcohol dehydrogenase family)